MTPHPRQDSKLTGITLKATPEGYFVLSIPLEDIPKALRIIAHFEPHMDVIEMVARVSSSAVRVHRVVSHTPEVPNGLVFLASAEVFPVRHKIIDRYVTQIGFCHFTNSRGKIAEVPDYMGGPMPR
jgi:hypothetical protein